MSHVKKQHYVPRFLLEKFTNQRGLIWYYDKELNRVEEKGIKGVAYEEYFYDKDPGKAETSLEYFLQRAETDAAPVIQKIITTKTLTKLTTDEKVTIGLFTALQLLRTKVSIKQTEDFNSQYMTILNSFIEDNNLEITLEQPSTRDLWFSSFESILDFGLVLVHKTWMLFESDDEFFFSDHPIVRQNSANIDKAEYRGVLGLNSDGIEIYFPFTPSIILGMCCERTYASLNNLIIPCNSEFIKNFNSFQAINADRFVFSKSNNFQLVEELLQQKMSSNRSTLHQ